MKTIRDWNNKEFYLKYWIFILLIFTTIISCLSYYLDYIEFLSFDKVNDLLINKFLINREGILISIAAIFIGIYFSIFTVLLTVKNNSKVFTMGLKTYGELIQFLRNSFIGSFIYVIYALLYPLISLLGQEGLIKFFCELALGLFVLYMLLSSLRVGLAFILIFKSDMEVFLKDVEKEKIQQEEYDDIIFQLKKFLEDNEQKEAIRKARELNDIVDFRNPKSKE